VAFGVKAQEGRFREAGTIAAGRELRRGLETHEGRGSEGGHDLPEGPALRPEESPGVAAELPTFSSSEEKAGRAGNGMGATARKRVRLVGGTCPEG
jgi:hypothetical protein